MKASPYIFEGPTVWSFSGGRTSGLMLHKAVEAYGGRLPSDHVVAFANTGKERLETLRFVEEVGRRWGIDIVWLEFRSRSGPAADRFEVVGPNSASRTGEPFSRLIESKKYTPNSVMRFCTEELKVNTVVHYVREVLGWTEWNNVIGLRHDEGVRVMKSLAKNYDRPKGMTWTNRVPLANDKISVRDVASFWEKQNFDLGLRPYEGNCDLCFLKGRKILEALIREDPASADWWIRSEEIARGSFNKEYSYSKLRDDVVRQGHLFDGFIDPSEYEADAECGTWCAPDVDTTADL